MEKIDTPQQRQKGGNSAAALKVDIVEQRGKKWHSGAALNE